MNVPSNISMQLVKRLNTWDVISANGEVIARFGLAHRRLAEAFPLLRQIGDPPVKALGSDPSATPLQNRQTRNCPMPKSPPEAVSRTLTDRLAARLGKHEKELTVFLWDDAVDGTNNAAERALRPAVVMRKITGGSRSERGARATAVLMSVLRTAHQQNRPLFETIKTLLMNAWAGKNPGLLTDILVDSS